MDNLDELIAHLASLRDQPGIGLLIELDDGDDSPSGFGVPLKLDPVFPPWRESRATPTARTESVIIRVVRAEPT